MHKNANKGQTDEYDDTDIKLLMGEYDRLKGLAIENDSAQHRRFDFYLVAATAIIAGIISLQKTGMDMTTVDRMTYLLLVAWLVWGIVAFVNLTYMNVSERHIINAINAIQNLFFERTPELKEHFYFRSSKVRWAGFGIKGILLRGITGGGLKSTLAVINSFILAYLCFQFWTLAINEPARVIVTMIAFVLSGIMHVLYVGILYKLKPL